MAVCMFLEGSLGVFTARSKMSFRADRLMCVSKYVIATFEIALCGLVFTEKLKLNQFRLALKGQTQDAEITQQTTTAFLVYGGLCLLPQIVYWGFFVYIVCQFSNYTRGTCVRM